MKLIKTLVNAEGPNQYLSKFKGTIEFDGKKISLSTNNFLLRGCILRNVDYVFGIATYTGYISHYLDTRQKSCLTQSRPDRKAAVLR